MFKRIYLSLILIMAAFLFGVLPVCALRWGVIQDYDKDNKWKKQYITYKLLKNIPIKYSIDKIGKVKVEPTLFHENYEDVLNELERIVLEQEEEAKCSKIIITGFNTWLKNTKTMIENDGRKKEFTDIMPILSKGISLEKVSNRKDADITFTFSDIKNLEKICGKGTAGCVYIDRHELFLPNPMLGEKEKQFAQFTAIHELGHFYGLADQYLTLKSDIHDTYNTPNRIGNNDSIMASEHVNNLKCDDVDGFINLIDLTLSMINNEEFSARAQNGWASFCNGKRDGKGALFTEEFYKNAKIDHIKELRKKDPFELYYTKRTYKSDNSFTVKDEDYNITYIFAYEKQAFTKYVDVDDQLSLFPIYAFYSDKLGARWDADNETFYIYDTKCRAEIGLMQTNKKIIVFDIVNNKLKYNKEESTSDFSEEQINIYRAKCDFIMWKNN